MQLLMVFFKAIQENCLMPWMMNGIDADLWTFLAFKYCFKWSVTPILSHISSILPFSFWVEDTRRKAGPYSDTPVAYGRDQIMELTGKLNRKTDWVSTCQILTTWACYQVQFSTAGLQSSRQSLLTGVLYATARSMFVALDRSLIVLMYLSWEGSRLSGHDNVVFCEKV